MHCASPLRSNQEGAACYCNPSTGRSPTDRELINGLVGAEPDATQTEVVPEETPEQRETLDQVLASEEPPLNELDEIDPGVDVVPPEGNDGES